MEVLAGAVRRMADFIGLVVVINAVAILEVFEDD
jgi:hypothetical protein